jgi:hypothetical protein
MTVNLQSGDVVQFRVWSSDSEQAAVNTFHYLCIAPPVGTVTDFDAAVEFDTVIAANLKAMLYNGAVYNGVECRVVNRLPLSIFQVGNAGTGAGTAGAVGMARQDAGLTGWTTALAGPGNRGRTFWPFPSVTDNQGLGVPTAGYQGKQNTIVGTLIGLNLLHNVAVTATIAVAMVVRRKGAFPPVTITSATDRGRWATQRRRGSYGRVNVSPI